MTEHASELERVWASVSDASDADAGLHESVAKLMGVVHQFRFAATDEQRAKAVTQLDETRRTLYGIFADYPRVARRPRPAPRVVQLREYSTKNLAELEQARQDLATAKQSIDDAVRMSAGVSRKTRRELKYRRALEGMLENQRIAEPLTAKIREQEIAARDSMIRLRTIFEQARTQ